MENKNKTKNLLNKFLLLFTSILLFVISNPNVVFTKGIGFFGFFIYVPVLILIYFSNIYESIFFGGFYGLFSYGIYVYWLKTFDSVCLLAVCIVYFVIFAIVFLLLKLLEKFFKNNAWILQCLCLSSFEYIKTLGFLGFSYGVSAYTQWKNLLFIQICNIIGVYGLNLFIIFCSSLISKVIISGMKKEKLPLKSIIFCSACFLFIVIYGKINLGKYKSYSKKKIIAVQSNESPWKNGIDEYTKTVQNLMKLTDEALKNNKDASLVVWPENAVVPAILYYYENKNDKKRNELIINLLEYIDSKNVSFVIGNGHKEEKNGKTDFYNSALFFEPEKNVLPPSPKIYSKMKLVPFTEYFPYKKQFPKFYQKLLKKNYHMWTSGKDVKVFSSDKLYFSTPICFEDTFPEICRKMVNNGAKCFINLSNDSWSNSVVCQNQHLAMAVFRSVENKVPTVRSSTSGQTCFIMPDGKISEICEPFTSNYVVQTVPVIPQYEKNTIYSKIGDIFGIIPLIVFLILLIIKVLYVIIKISRK